VLRRTVSILGLLVFVAAAPACPVAAQSAAPAIRSPAPGDALQGTVSLDGTSQVDGFVSAEIDFAYHGDPTGTWFTLQTSLQPVTDGVLALWDTTAVSDGTYDLRLRVSLSNGQTVDVIVPDLRVRNYTPIETATPTQVIPQATPLPTVTLTATPYPTPTPLPGNPAVITPGSVGTSLGVGGLVTILFLALLGLYLRARRK